MREPVAPLDASMPVQVVGHSDPAAQRRCESSRGHVVENVRFAQESSCPFAVFAYLYVAPHVNGIALRRTAEIDAPRTGVGTVPRTVPGAIQIASWNGSPAAFSWPIAGPSSSEAATAIVGLNPEGTAKPVCEVVWKPTCAATRSATSAAIPKPVPNAVCGVIRRPSSAADRNHAATSNC